MRILVSFKVTPDFEALRDADWSAGAPSGVDTRFVRRILNCFDESALELALRVSDALAGGAADRRAGSRLAALTIGGRETEPYLKTLQALGYEAATRVQTEADLDFAPVAVAAIVAAYAREADHSDLLLLGCRSGPGDSGAVPLLVAERLGWPCLTQVLEVEPVDDDRLRVTCAVDGGLLRTTVRLPCVLAVGNAVVSHLRVPTLKDRLAHRDERIEVVEAGGLGVDVTRERGRGACVLEGLDTIDRSRSGIIIDGKTPREKARTLYEAHLKTVVERL